MLLRFDWKPIRERDEEGRLAAAGLQWTEKRQAAFATFVMIGMLALMGGIAALLSESEQAVGYGRAMLAVFIASWAAARLAPGRTRALIFHRDGSTSAPYGFAHYKSRFREVTGTNANFVSIEARTIGQGDSDVIAFTHGGDVLYIAGRLHRDSAHKVAVQLTLALTELRESLGNERRTSGPTVMPTAAETIID